MAIARACVVNPRLDANGPAGFSGPAFLCDRPAICLNCHPADLPLAFCCGQSGLLMVAPAARALAICKARHGEAFIRRRLAPLGVVVCDQGREQAPGMPVLKRSVDCASSAGTPEQTEENAGCPQKPAFPRKPAGETAAQTSRRLAVWSTFPPLRGVHQRRWTVAIRSASAAA